MGNYNPNAVQNYANRAKNFILKKAVVAGQRRPTSILTTATVGATSIGGGEVRTPPANHRVVLMKRAANLAEELPDASSSVGGRGDADSFSVRERDSKTRYADRTAPLRRNQLINVHAEDEFPPLMSPASSAVSSPHKVDKFGGSERRQQQQSEIVRAGGRGILNMLKRDGLLNENVTISNNNNAVVDENVKLHHRQQRYGPPSSSLTRENHRKADDRARTDTSRYEKQQKFHDNTDQILNNSSTDSAYYTNVGSHQLNGNNYYQAYYAAGDFTAVDDNYVNAKHSANISRKSSVGRKYDDNDEDDSALHDLDEAERITEKLSTTQARIKQQINAKLEFEKQQRLNGERKLTVSSNSSGKTDPAAAKPLPPATKLGENVAGVMKLVKPAANGVQRDAVTKPAPRPANRKIAPTALHTLNDHTLKDKYLPKPQCLINHNLDWQESTQKLLLREYLDEQNEMFTVIAVCGPQSSGKSTILSCLGIQSMGNFHLFDHDAELVSPAQRQTSSINIYINAKQRVILLDSPGMLSTQLLAELMNRPTRPPPLFNGDKLNNVSGVHVYLEHQAEVYAYQLAAFLFAVSHVVLFCSDHMPVTDYYAWVVEFLHKTCIMKPSVLAIDLQNPLCGVVNVEEMLAQQRAELRAKRLAEKAEHSSYTRLSATRTDQPRGRRAADASRNTYQISHFTSRVKESIADHWPNLYFIVNKACDDGAMKLCNVPDDRVRLEKALKSLVSATPLGRATRFTDKLRISTANVRGDEEKWSKLANEDCQLFVVPFVGQQRTTTTTNTPPSIKAGENTNMNGDNDEDYGDEEYNPALRFIFDDNLTLSYKITKPETKKTAVSLLEQPFKQRAGILTGVKLTPYGFIAEQQHRPLGARTSTTLDRFRHIRSTQKWQPSNYSSRSTSFYRRPRAGLISRTPSSHVCRHAHYRGGGVEQAFYTDLSNVEKFIVEKQPKKAATDTASETGTVTWKDVLANKQAYDTIARLRRTCFNAPALPITPGVRMSEKQWLRYASAMWSHIKSDTAILNYARAINMASSSSTAAGT